MRHGLTYLLFFILIPLQAQQTYYVSPAGNDAANGSSANPWQHIQYALQHIQTGDTLVLNDGVYNEKIRIPLSGICLRAAHLRSAVLDGSGITSSTAMIYIQDQSNIVIDGLEIRNNVMNDAAGIYITGSGTDIVIRNCYLHDIHFSSGPNAPVNEQTNAQGIIVYGTSPASPYTNITIENNELANCRLGYSEGIALNGNLNGFVVHNNTVHHLTNIGIDLIGGEGTCPVDSLDAARNGSVTDNHVFYCLSDYATSAGIYVDGGQHILIAPNRCEHNGYGVEIGCENPRHETRHIHLKNNFILSNAEAGLAFGGYDYPANSGKVRNCQVLNNTFWMNDTTQSGSGSLYLTYIENSQIQNNIFVTADDDLIYAENAQPGLIMDYNLYYDTDGDDTDNGIDFDGTYYNGLSAFRSQTGNENHGFYTSPALQPDTTGLPRLTQSSPVDTGNPSCAPANETDFFGNPRLVGVAVDNGAEEWQQLSVSANGNFFHIYPNPFDNIIFLPRGITVHYRFYDQAGRLLNRETATGFIRPGPMARGVYWLHIREVNGHRSTIIPVIHR